MHIARQDAVFLGMKPCILAGFKRCKLISLSKCAHSVVFDASESDTNKAQGSRKSDQPSKKRSSKKDYAAWAAATPENRAQPPKFVNSSSAPGELSVQFERVT